MIHRLCCLALLLFFPSIGDAATCLPVTGDFITARDLATAFPALQGVDPNAVFGRAPSPGHLRSISPPELRRWALTHKLNISPAADLCVSHAKSEIADSVVQEALQNALRQHFQLDLKPEEIKLLTFTTASPGPGRMDFPSRGLLWVEERQILRWRGTILPTGHSSQHPITCEFAVTRTIHLTKAGHDLAPLSTLRESDIEIATVAWRPLPADSYISMDRLLGQVTRRKIARGAILLPSLLKPPPIIAAGQNVDLVSRAGATQIRISAVATHNAYAGESLVVKRQDAKGLVRGIAVAPGLVVVENRGAPPRSRIPNLVKGTTDATPNATPLP